MDDDQTKNDSQEEIIEDQEVVEEEVEETEDQDSEDTEEQVETDNSRTADQFSKLKDNNKNLKAENEGYKNLLDSLMPDIPEAPQASNYQTLDQSDIDQTLADMQTQDGYIDGSKLMQVLKNLDDRNKRAEQRAVKAEEHVRKVEVALEGKDKSAKIQALHTKYPALDPESGEFNERFYLLVQNEMVGQMLKGQEDPIAAADKWNSLIFSNEDVTKKEKQQKDEAENKKAQIGAVQPKTSSTSTQYNQQQDDSLVERVRQGKKGAVAEMLRKHEERARNR